MGKSVLVASYTNAAVDNVLLKLEDLEVAFVRVGRPTKIHPRIMKYTLGGEAYSDTTLKSIKEIRETVSVVSVDLQGTLFCAPIVGYMGCYYVHLGFLGFFCWAPCITSCFDSC